MAELKLRSSSLRISHASCLHGFTAVAELKHEVRRAVMLFADPSPRLHRRGRIEALYTGLVGNPDARSPRLHRRGRIEAIIAATTNPTNNSSLHGFTAVAELKRLCFGQLSPVFRGLHGFTAVAELKPFPFTHPERVILRLHGFTAVAELKPWHGS